MGAYVLNRHNTVSQYIATRTILDLCKETVGRSGEWVARILWEQEVLDLAGARLAAADREGGGEGGDEER